MVIRGRLLGDWPLGLETEKPKGTFCVEEMLLVTRVHT